MKIYNTLTRQKDEFAPMDGKEVRMYACGPTVYNFIHIGNARPLIVFDSLRRYFEWRGWKVNFVQNFTDIDDKIINRANEEGISSKEVAEKYIAEYWTDVTGLGVRAADVHPKATETIPEIIEMVSTLIEKGYAYEVNGDVYYRTFKFADYGKLSHQPLEELQAGARIDVNDIKENPMDFALWKAAKPGEPYWESPWGNGRPGWHIECSAMSKKFLGESIDIHCGGQDLAFPHHENEIAQSEAANGCKFVNYWLHNGYININNQKMSKSLNNFFTVREAAGAYGYETLRMFMLSAHYRSPLNYSEEALLSAKASLERLYSAYNNMKFLAENAPDGELDARVEGLGKYRDAFIEAMDNDFNTADGVSALFELTREVNSICAAASNPSRQTAEACFKAFTELTNVFGLLYNAEEDSLDDEIEKMISARQAARKEKNWAEADRIRDELKAMGIVLEDTPQGVKWKKA